MEQKVPQEQKVPRERKGRGVKGLGNELARERRFQGANWPASYWPICSGEGIGQGTKRLGTVFTPPHFTAVPG